MYQGGKQRVGGKIADVIRPLAEEYDTLVVPFVGMGGVMRNLPEFKEIIVSDLNADVVAFWRKTRTNWKPKHYKERTKAMYSRLEKAQLKSDSARANRLLFMLVSSFNRNMRNFTETPFTNQTIDNYVKKARVVKNVTVGNAGSYTQYLGCKNCVFYMDPPYFGVGGYTRVGAFDHKQFWKDMKQLAKHNVVFVSHYDLPKFAKAELVATFQSYIGSQKKGSQKRIEKLYLVSS